MTDSKDISEIRREYSREILSENSVDKNPLNQFLSWMNEAIEANILEPNAMALATTGKDLIPSVRIVLLKGADEKGFVFFTNYGSKKGQELSANPNVSLLFFWKELERQVRITGRVEKTTKEESELYYNSRPLESRLGAWASKQSSKLNGREVLETKYEEYRIMYEGKQIPLPPYWGGYRVIPSQFEFWQGRKNRLHDRIAYFKNETGWEIVRLSP